ncbi:MAG: C45 family peptidase [Actinomycetia bacterium]|nr:C45 family peptidase [Actinomycetes bacterium]
MADKPLIPVLRVQGSHREVGRQIGAACAAAVHAVVGFGQDMIPGDGRTMAEQMRVAEDYRSVTQRLMPHLVEELEGVAEGAEVDPLSVFAASVEEIWAEADDPSEGAVGSSLGSERGRCSDLVAGPPSTVGGTLLVAHNNDLDAGVDPNLTGIDWNVDGEPRVFSIGIGPWISVGWNSAGLMVSGNEIAPNDERVGLPRLLLVREELRQTSIAGMMGAALHPERASSYNNIFAHRDGEVVDIEGSATDSVTMTLSPTGTLVHTNHYVCDAMLGYEGDPEYAELSAIRFNRGMELMEQASAQPGTINENRLIEMLSDHENAPDSLCRHPSPGRSSVTVFWCITNVTTGQVTFGRGNPCDSVPQNFHFETA